ncbi:MAG: diaminopimelate epimerase [Candidatus Omnitrophica bacterium]|nr:diaminopimelate epimerase [Candidatus Omnitrophota bacterium]
MAKLDFLKLQASGNDFVLVEAENLKRQNTASYYKKLARFLCRPKLGIGADGLLLIDKSISSDFKMLIFNADGSEAEMCGNGARCASLWQKLKSKKNRFQFETKAGIIKAAIEKDQIKIKLSDPFDLQENIKLNLLGRQVKVQYINTGVPHAIVFVDGLDLIDVETLGSSIRFHSRFAPQGTNVNFVEVLKSNTIAIRTYERGVGETLACGTGSVASAIVTRLALDEFGHKTVKSAVKTNVVTRSKEVLKVYFDYQNTIVDNVWLQGKADLVYQGQIDI